MKFLRLAGAAALVGGASWIVHVAPAQAGVSACVGNTFRSSTVCTVAPHQTVYFTIKGGNGGHGGSGGYGGMGGHGWDGTFITYGGGGGPHGSGGLGGDGARVSGVYTNDSDTDVLLVLTLGADGAQGTSQPEADRGIDAAESGPPTVGGDGPDGLPGGTGGTGTSSSIVINSVTLVEVGPGTGGTPGEPGKGGKGGPSSASAIAASGEPGAHGVQGSEGHRIIPASLPAGWVDETRWWGNTAFVSFTGTPGGVPGSGLPGSGANTAPILIVGGGLLGAGLLIAVASRRRSPR